MIINSNLRNYQRPLKKASCKLHACRGLRPYLTTDNARVLTKSFIHNQFNHAPLILKRFAGKTASNKICKIHYRTLKEVCNNFTDSYDARISINNHCVKSVRIPSYSCPHSPVFGLNTRKFGPE